MKPCFSARCLLGGLGLAAALAVCLRLAPGSSTSPGAISPDRRLGSPASDPGLSPADARAKAIRDTMASLREECQRSAGGDYGRWVDQLAEFRRSLLTRIREAKPYNPGAQGWFEGRSPVLEGRGDFPLFEAAPEYYLKYIYEPASLDAFRTGRAVALASRWFERRGIDVIFVPVPKMTEAHAAQFADHCPADGIVAPQMRRLIFELLESDVEVVDLLPLFLKARDREPAPLYQTADPHWAPRAWAIAAKAVGDRLRRYEFVSKALAGPRMCQPFEVPFMAAKEGAAYPALSPRQKQRADAAQPKTHPFVRDCSHALADPASQVIVIGDSYIGGFWEQLTQEINLPVNQLSGGGNTTHALKDFLRDPESLSHCKVVVWLVCNSNLTADWPLPKPIRELPEDSLARAKP